MRVAKAIELDALKLELPRFGRIIEAGCWSHARRKFWDIHVRQKRQPGTLAHQALVRIGELFRIEAEVNGRSALRRRRAVGAGARGIEVLDERDLGAGVGEVADGAGDRL